MNSYEMDYSYVPRWEWCLYKTCRDNDGRFPVKEPFPSYRGMTFSEAQELQSKLNDELAEFETKHGVYVFVENWQAFKRQIEQKGLLKTG
jgi:hypothetical protein